jgi:hypothetical protein
MLTLPMTSALLVSSSCAGNAQQAQLTCLRTRGLVAQEGWVTGVDQSGQAYFFNDQTNEFQYEPPAAVQRFYGGQVLWRLLGSRTGTHYWCNYELKNGDVQSLSRFNMLTQKLTVSRVQCIVQVHDGMATLTSCGRGPTLWRQRGLNWVALDNGDQVPLNDGDQISLDCSDPEGAVFECVDASVAQHGGYQQGYAQQAQLTYPWEQLVDQNGNVYYANSQTGEASWEPPQQGIYWQQQQQGGGYGQQQAG